MMLKTVTYYLLMWEYFLYLYYITGTITSLEEFVKNVVLLVCLSVI